MSENIKIRIKNWQKFNPRNDVKSSSWLRLNHDFFTHPDFYDWTFEERCFWLFLLCEKSKLENDKDVPLIVDHCHRTIGFDKKVIDRMLKKLKQKQMIDIVTVRGRYASDTDTGSTYVRDERTDEDMGREAQPKYILDEIYREYPRRSGSQRKGIGLARLGKLIKSEPDYALALAAVQSYKRHCMKEKIIGTTFVKQFGTFFDPLGDWKEWAEKKQTGYQPDQDALIKQAFGDIE